MLATEEPFEEICGTLVVNVSVCCAVVTITVVLPETPPLLALTVMTVLAATPSADSVAVA